MPLCMTIRHDGVITPGIVVRMMNGRYCIPFFVGDVNDNINTNQLEEGQDEFCIYFSKIHKPQVFERPKHDGTNGTEKYVLEGYMDMSNFTFAGSSGADNKKHLLVCLKNIKGYHYKSSLNEIQWIDKRIPFKDFLLLIPNNEQILQINGKPVRLQFPRNT